jgi:hypothetical protein
LEHDATLGFDDRDLTLHLSRTGCNRFGSGVPFSTGIQRIGNPVSELGRRRPREYGIAPRFSRLLRPGVCTIQQDATAGIVRVVRERKLSAIEQRYLSETPAITVCAPSCFLTEHTRAKGAAAMSVASRLTSNRPGKVCRAGFPTSATGSINHLSARVDFLRAGPGCGHLPPAWWPTTSWPPRASRSNGVLGTCGD